MNRFLKIIVIGGLILQNSALCETPLAFRKFLNETRNASFEAYKRQSPSLTRKNFAEIKAYILNYYDGVKVKRSFAGENGRAVDCVVTETQPALHRRNFLGQLACGDGTIPLQRLTVGQMTGFGSVAGFLRKSEGERAPLGK